MACCVEIRCIGVPPYDAVLFPKEVAIAYLGNSIVALQFAIRENGKASALCFNYRM
jgi:hypothetical protein